MLPFRGWELLAGSLVAYLKVYQSKNYKLNENSIFSKILIYLSFLNILFYLFFFDVNLLHPSFYTFFLILSVSIIIWFDKSKNFITKLLSKKFLIFFGLISYSLYLWHYPLFAFARHFYGVYLEEIISIKLSIIIISIIFSIFTFYFIERPFRKKNLARKKLFFFLLTLLFLILTPSIYIIKNNGFEERLELSNYQKKIFQYKKSTTLIKNNTNSFKNNNKKKILIIGNSHGRDFYATLTSNENLTKNNDFNHFWTQIDCLEDILTTGKNFCQRTFNRDKLKTLNDINNFNKSEILILKTKWYEDSLNSLEKTINFLKKTNKKIILVSDFPAFAYEASAPYVKPKNFNKNFQQKTYYLQNLPLERYILENNKFPNKIEIKKIEEEYYSLLNKKIIKNNIFLNQIAKKHNIIFLDHFSLICDQNKKSCITSTPNNEIIHKDTAGHITKYGAEFLGKKMRDNGWFRID